MCQSEKKKKDSVGLGSNLRVCIYNKLPADALLYTGKSDKSFLFL